MELLYQEPSLRDGQRQRIKNDTRLERPSTLRNSKDFDPVKSQMKRLIGSEIPLSRYAWEVTKTHDRLF
jgi:hypothetical protein